MWGGPRGSWSPILGDGGGVLGGSWSPILGLGGVLVPNYGVWGGPGGIQVPCIGVCRGWGGPGPQFWGVGGGSISLTLDLSLHCGLWGMGASGSPILGDGGVLLRNNDAWGLMGGGGSQWVTPPPLTPDPHICAPPPPRAVVPQWRVRWW